MIALLSDMPPSRSAFNLTDNWAPHVEFSGQIACSLSVFRAPFYFSHFGVCKFGVNAALSARHKAKSHSVTSVVRQRKIFEIGRQIVKFVAVDMIDGQPGWARPDKGCGDQPMHREHTADITSPKINDAVALPANRSALNRARSAPTNAAKTAHVVAFNGSDRTPFFLSFHSRNRYHIGKQTTSSLAAAYARRKAA